MFDCGATESEARDPLLRTMRNCEWATSHIFISLALSALLGYPTTGRAGWGADVHFMGLENNMTSAARRMLELETSYMVARQYSVYGFVGGSLSRQHLFCAAQNLG